MTKGLRLIPVAR